MAGARRVFDGMARKNTVTWTAIIDGYLKCNLDDEAFKLFQDSVKHGVPANSKMFVCIMNLCGKRVNLKLGKQIHARILKSIFMHNVEIYQVHFGHLIVWQSEM